jgi:hypothetical protein
MSFLKRLRSHRSPSPEPQPGKPQPTNAAAADAAAAAATDENTFHHDPVSPIIIISPPSRHNFSSFSDHEDELPKQPHQRRPVAWERTANRIHHQKTSSATPAPTTAIEAHGHSALEAHFSSNNWSTSFETWIREI